MPLEKPPAPSKPARATRDTLCKRLAEEYPAQFARWLFGAGGQVKVEKTELSREPIRADAVIFSRGENEMLHAEFQTTIKSKVPMPLRLLDYYVGLKRLNPHRRVRQVLVVLKDTGEAIPDRYEDERTLHAYEVIKLWEQDPAELLKHEGLLPLATLCRTESSERLLRKVAVQVNRIKSRAHRREVLNWSRVLAGLRYDKNLVYQILKESDMLEESVVYQDIFQKGQQHAFERGAQQEGRTIAQRQLERRFGKLPLGVRRQIERLAVTQLEELCDALLDFQTRRDMLAWFKQRAING